MIGAETLKRPAASGLRLKSQAALVRMPEGHRGEILRHQPVDGALGIGGQPRGFLDDAQRLGGCNAVVRGVIRGHELAASRHAGQRVAGWPIIKAHCPVAITVLFYKGYPIGRSRRCPEVLERADLKPSYAFE